MKRLLLIPLTVLTCWVGACAAATTAADVVGSVVNASTPVATVGSNVVVEGQKALAVAADAYAGVADSIAVAVKAGHFSKTQLQMISTLNNQALAFIKGTDTSLTFAQRAAGIMLIVTQLHSILGA